VSYHIYTTKGLVLAATPVREADRVYAILTRDLGLIRASAAGVRKEGSKLRGAVEPFVIAQVSLVRGKEYWRLTSAEALRSVAAAPSLARPLALLQQLVQGEEANSELFDVIEQFVSGQRGDGEMLEAQFAAHILYHLGYLKKEDMNLDKKELIKAINDGLRQSQLA
jgi:DNA repair protein RecO